MTGSDQYMELQRWVPEPHGSVSTVASVLTRQTSLSDEEALVVAHAVKNDSIHETADALDVDTDTIRSYAESALSQLDSIDESIISPPFN